MAQAYVYQWTEKSTGMWYIGSRTKKNCHPDDGYICSSKVVKPLIEKNPKNWVREILFIGDPKEAIAMESKLLCDVDAAKNPMSYNQHNQNMKWTRLGCKDTPEVLLKKSKARTGSKNPSFGKCGELSPNWGRKHKPRSAETLAKISAANKGKPSPTKGMKMPPMTDEQRKKISIALKGKVSPMKGKTNPNVSESNKKRIGIKRPEHSLFMTGRTWKYLKSTCPHCNKIGGGGNMKKYHFEKCKLSKGNINGIA